MPLPAKIVAAMIEGSLKIITKSNTRKSLEFLDLSSQDYDAQLNFLCEKIGVLNCGLGLHLREGRKSKTMAQSHWRHLRLTRVLYYWTYFNKGIVSVHLRGKELVNQKS